MKRVYLDHNATTYPSSELKARIPELLEIWGNPSSVHHEARGPKRLLREARQAIASLVGADPLEIVFTSGGTESNNLAIKGVFGAFRRGRYGKFRNHYLFSGVEHPSVRRTMEYLKEEGAHVEEIQVSADGSINLEAFGKQLRDDTALVSVMLANNETGNIFPVKKMAKLAHKNGALFHTDAVQSLGKMLIQVKDLDVDLASFSAHKVYSLKGAGALYCKRGVVLESLLHGGGQERHRRGGTENLLAIASWAEVANRKDEIPQAIERMSKLRDEMEDCIKKSIPNVAITGRDQKRVSNTSSIVIDDIDGEILLMKLDLEGFSVSTGSACSSGSQEPSLALRKMGLSRTQAQASLRVSLGWQTTQDEVRAFCTVLPRVVEEIRNLRKREYLSSGIVAPISDYEVNQNDNR